MKQVVNHGIRNLWFKKFVICKGACGRRDLNPSFKLGKQEPTGEKLEITEHDFERYLTRRDIVGLSTQWQGQCTQWLKDYLDFVNWKIDEDKTLDYCRKLKETTSVTYYRKKIYQIRRFLEQYKVEWASTIRLPPEPEYMPKGVSRDTIQETLSFYKEHRFFI